MRTHEIVASFACVVLSGSACGGSSTPTPPTQQPTLSIRSSNQLYFAGESYRLNAMFQQPGQTAQDVTVQATWSSSDPSVATVNAGIVNVLVDGKTADITVKYQDVTSKVTVSTGWFLIKADPGVSATDQDIVRDGANVAIDYYASKLGWVPEKQITITLTTASGSTTATSAPSALTVFVTGSEWLVTAAELKRKIIGHELFHVLQYTIAWLGNHTILDDWLVEGSAEYMGYRAEVIDRGIQGADQTRGCHQFSVDNSSTLVTLPLSKLENQGDFQAAAHASPAYSLAYLAAERAAQDRGLGSFIDYGRSAATASLAVSFQNGFGKPLSQFYDEFETYRRTWVHSPNYTCLH